MTPRAATDRRRRLLPCVDRTVIDDGTVVIDGDRIAWVGPTTEVPDEYAGVPSTDATGRTVMPGLVDAHMHISFGEAAQRGGAVDPHAGGLPSDPRRGRRRSRAPRRRDDGLRPGRPAGHRCRRPRRHRGWSRRRARDCRAAGRQITTAAGNRRHAAGAGSAPLSSAFGAARPWRRRHRPGDPRRGEGRRRSDQDRRVGAGNRRVRCLHAGRAGSRGQRGPPAGPPDHDPRPARCRRSPTPSTPASTGSCTPRTWTPPTLEPGHRTRHPARPGDDAAGQLARGWRRSVTRRRPTASVVSSTRRWRSSPRPPPTGRRSSPDRSPDSP